jgi:hypothetical protein
MQMNIYVFFQNLKILYIFWFIDFFVRFFFSSRFFGSTGSITDLVLITLVFTTHKRRKGECLKIIHINRKFKLSQNDM